MSEAKVSFEDVVGAVHVLESRGEPVNPFRLRVVLGRGGYKTIEKHLLKYQAAERATQPPPPPLAKLADLSASLWDAARREAHAEFDAERQQLFALLEERERHVAVVEEGRRHEEQQRTLAERLLVEKENEARRLLAQLEDERRQREAVERRCDLNQSDFLQLSRRQSDSFDRLVESQQQVTRHVENLVDSQREWLELKLSSLAEQMLQGNESLASSLENRLVGAIHPLETKLEGSQADLATAIAMLGSLSRYTEGLAKTLHLQQVRDRKARMVADSPRLMSRPPGRRSLLRK